jgi:excisionase family DNA binding protein
MEPPQVERKFLRPNEAAQALGCSRTRIYELIYSGYLPHVRLGGTALRIPMAAIEQMIEAALNGYARTAKTQSQVACHLKPLSNRSGAADSVRGGGVPRKGFPVSERSLK